MEAASWFGLSSLLAGSGVSSAYTLYSSGDLRIQLVYAFFGKAQQVLHSGLKLERIRVRVIARVHLNLQRRNDARLLPF